MPEDDEPTPPPEDDEPPPPLPEDDDPAAPDDVAPLDPPEPPSAADCALLGVLEEHAGEPMREMTKRKARRGLRIPGIIHRGAGRDVQRRHPQSMCSLVSPLRPFVPARMLPSAPRSRVRISLDLPMALGGHGGQSPWCSTSAVQGAGRSARRRKTVCCNIVRSSGLIISVAPSLWVASRTSRVSRPVMMTTGVAQWAPRNASRTANPPQTGIKTSTTMRSIGGARSPGRYWEATATRNRPPSATRSVSISTVRRAEAIASRSSSSSSATSTRAARRFTRDGPPDHPKERRWPAPGRAVPRWSSPPAPRRMGSSLKSPRARRLGEPGDWLTARLARESPTVPRTPGTDRHARAQEPSAGLLWRQWAPAERLGLPRG